MKKNNIFVGVLLILAALFIVFDSFGFISDNIGIFKIIFTVILAGITIKGITKINFSLILFPLALIGILFSKELNITELTPWPILIIASLLSIGLSLIFSKKTPFNFTFLNSTNSIMNGTDESTINCEASFGSAIKYINTNDFKSAKIDVAFGNIKAYFDNAEIIGNEAKIFLDAAFSTVEIYVPQNWTIIQEVDSAFGGVDEKNNRGLKENGPTVYLYGDIAFSGITIYYC